MGVRPQLGVPTALTVDGLAAGGRGVARHDGMVWFVEGGVPGDRVIATPRGGGARWVDARMERLIEPSSLRRRAPCPIQDRCGGCPWMVLEEDVQRTWKRSLVEDALTRIGKLDGIVVEPVIASPKSLEYRNKVELTFGRTANGAVVVGYHPPGDPRGLVDVRACALQDEAANRALEVVRRFFQEGPGRDAAVVDDPREPLRLVLRRSTRGRMLVALRGREIPFPAEHELAATLVAAVPEVVSVVRLLATPGRRGSTRTRALVGVPWLEEDVAGLRFRLPASSFFQVNPGAAEILVDTVLELSELAEGASVLELYGGIGVFSLALARRGARAVVCEADPEAVDCGRRAAQENGGLPVTFERADVARFLSSFEGTPRIVIADPPRTGLGMGVGEALAATGAERLILVSCDAPTLARDVRLLVAEGYVPGRVVPIDLFPQTPHVEVVLCLERAGRITARARRRPPRAGSRRRASGSR